MGYTLNDDEVAIIIKPEYGEDGEWNNIISTGIVISQEVPNGMAGAEMLQAAMLMSAAFMYNDEYPDFIEELYPSMTEIAKQLFPDQYEEVMANMEEDTKPVYKKEGNVLTLNAKTKTVGSA